MEAKMARAGYGNWGKSANEHGRLIWTGTDGKGSMEVDCASLVGGKKHWDGLTPSGQFIVAYGEKQWVSDGLAGKADTSAQYRTMLTERIQALMAGEAVTGGFPYV